MKKQVKVSFLFTLISTLSLGIIYPVLLTGIGFFIPSLTRPPFPLQPFQRADLFQGRPSMSGGPYSGASNLSFTNPELQKLASERFKRFMETFPSGVFPSTRIPYDLLFASASGYDPDLSVEGAMNQILPIAKAHNIPVDRLTHLVNRHTHPKLWGFIGSDTVNVASLNQEIKKLDQDLF